METYSVPRHGPAQPGAPCGLLLGICIGVYEHSVDKYVLDGGRGMSAGTDC